jgi:hypothetical protein
MAKQELPINNPAERLYVILTRAAESSGNIPIPSVLCTAMELEESVENFIKGSNELLILLEVIEKEIKQYFSHRKQTIYLGLTKEIKTSIINALALVFRENTYEWFNVENLNNRNWQGLQSLYICMDNFEEYGIKYGISIHKNLLNELINDIDIWIEEINESQLDEEIKKFLIHKLIGIKHLLEKYYYYGSSGIQKEIYATMVEIGLYQEDLTEDKKEESRSFFKDSFEKLSKWAGIVNAPMNTVVIADKLLPIISQTAELVGNTVKHLLPPGI